MSVQDTVFIFAESDYRVWPTKHASEVLSTSSEPASSTKEQDEPTTAV